MKTKMITLATLLFTLLIFTTTYAQNPRLKSPLTTEDLGKTLKVCYDISGLGNVDNITATLTYTATVTSLCYNPGQKDGPVPGQTKTFSGVQEEIVIPVHNGRAIGCFTTQKTFPAGDCPNDKWRGEVSDVKFSEITLTVDGKEFRAPNPR